MDAIKILVQLLGGLIWLLMGGDLLVRGAVALARRLRVSPVLIALSLVAFGTSLPELVVTVRAALAGYSGIVIGNIVGSNIANVLLVVGVPAIIYPLTSSESSTRRDGLVMLAVSLLFVGFCFVGDLGHLTGVVLLVLLGLMSLQTARDAARSQRAADRSAPTEWVLGLPSSFWMIGLFVVGGAIGLPLGARLFIDASVDIAERLQVSGAFVGLTIVALGTSLPELTTCVIAVLQRQTGVALGTAVGSNIFNILAIMGVAAVVSPTPIPVPGGFLTLDLPVMLTAALLLTVIVWRRRPIGRVTGAFLLAGYAAFVTALFIRA